MGGKFRLAFLAEEGKFDLLSLTALNLSVAIEAEIREGLLAVDGVVGAGLAGHTLEKPVQALETTNSLKLVLGCTETCD